MKAFAPLSKTRTRRGMNEQASAWLGAIEGLPAVHQLVRRVAVVGPKEARVVIRRRRYPSGSP
jgi:DNA adenine methylase